MSAEPTILITGANRGIGLALAKSYHSKGYKIIAAIRDVTKAPELEGVIAVKVDSSSRTDAKQAVEELKSKHGIEKIDVVIANSGISEHLAKAKDTDIDELNRHHLINTQGPLVLFQAVYPLLKEGSKFVVISSAVGSNTLDHPPLIAAYGASKTAINFLARQIHFEEPHITTIFLHPGMVESDMGLASAKFLGMEDVPNRLDDTIPQIVKLVDSATREEHSGNFYNFDGSKFPF